MKQPLLIPILYDGLEEYQNVSRYDLVYKGHPIWVEEGYVCDGASVPSVFWRVMLPDGLHRPGYLFHDRFYNSQGNHCGLHLTRREVDQMFYDLMIEAGVSPWRAKVAHFGVRIGGWAAWNSIEKPIIIPVRNAHVSRTKRKSPLRARHPYETNF